MKIDKVQNNIFNDMLKISNVSGEPTTYLYIDLCTLKILKHGAMPCGSKLVTFQKTVFFFFVVTKISKPQKQIYLILKINFSFSQVKQRY